MFSHKNMNRQMFLFIIFFYCLLIIFPFVLKFPQVIGAPKDEWCYLEELDEYIFTSWRENEDLPVKRKEAVLVFQAIEKNSETIDLYTNSLYERGIFLPGLDVEDIMLREELYRFVEMKFPVSSSTAEEIYFLGDTYGPAVNIMARLGIIDVPFDRLYKPNEHISRQEAASTLARAALPALRVNNAPQIVQPKQRYTYTIMNRDLKRLVAAYPELLTLQVIGQSVEGREIFAVRLGSGEKEIFIDGAIHASEWLTTPLVMKMLEEYTHHASYGFLFGDYDVQSLLEDVSFWFIPMLNPDGVTLVLEGIGAIKDAKSVRSIQKAHASKADFSDWKANIRGVDLNRQFPTGWRGMVNIKSTPASSNYPGSSSLSEPEARALYDFTLERRPVMVISYHQRGDTIFWYYRQQAQALQRDRSIVREMSSLTGYSYNFYLVNGGKYRDWAVTELGIPALIMEMGQRIGDLSEWERIWRQNRYVGLHVAKILPDILLW